MKKQSIYNDLIYSQKDYKKETTTIKRLISKYQKSKGKDLLEVACGTGGHALYLKNDFEVLATGASAEMLGVARKNVEGVTFRQA